MSKTTKPREAPSSAAAASSAALADYCVSCVEGDPEDEGEQCPESRRECGHHCNCTWDVEIPCHWCGWDPTDLPT